MKTDNARKKSYFRILVIVCLIVLAAELTLKLCGYEISDWLFVADSILLVICGILYKNYDKADKDDQRYD